MDATNNHKVSKLLPLNFFNGLFTETYGLSRAKCQIQQLA